MDITRYLEDRPSDSELDCGIEQPCHNSAKIKPIKMTDLRSLAEQAFAPEKCSELTVTFKPVLIDNWGEDGLKDMVELELRKALKKAPLNTQVLLIGEHSKLGMFHYHGLIQNAPNNILSCVKRRLNREIGRTNVRQISYHESYMDYIFKSYTGKLMIPEDWTTSSYIKINI